MDTLQSPECAFIFEASQLAVESRYIMNAIQALSMCTNPVQTAIVFNPLRPEYYLADELKESDGDTGQAVNVTLSEQARKSLGLSG